MLGKATLISPALLDVVVVHETLPPSAYEDGYFLVKSMGSCTDISNEFIEHINSNVRNFECTIYRE